MWRAENEGDAQIPRKGRYELYNSINMDYYGFRDEEDGTLLIKEAEVEAAAIEQEVAEWEEREAMKRSALNN